MKRKGFTLVEILVVVIIIVILAALIIPRFLNAPERAKVAEANQMLGVMMRAQQTRILLGNGFLQISDNTTAGPWNTLGLRPPGDLAPVGPANFSYSCDSAAQSCTAARTFQGVQSTVVVGTVCNYNAWACTGKYTHLANAACTL